MELEQKLLELEEKYVREEVPHRSRSMRAILDLGLTMPSSDAGFVSDWFSSRTRSYTTTSGVYEGAYYFDSEFWRVCVPLIYGTVSINPYEQLDEAPVSTVQRLAQTNQDHYLRFFGDCFDYGIRSSQLLGGQPCSFADSLFQGADEELRSASATLLIRPNPGGRAMLHARNACEIFMKSYLASEVNLDSDGAKAIGHDLGKAYDELAAAVPNEDFRNLRPVLDAFPPIHVRYEGSNFDRASLAQAFESAQFLGALIVRARTDA